MNHFKPWCFFTSYLVLVQAFQRSCDGNSQSLVWPLPLEFSRQEHWRGFPVPTPEVEGSSLQKLSRIKRWRANEMDSICAWWCGDWGRHRDRWYMVEILRKRGGAETIQTSAFGPASRKNTWKVPGTYLSFLREREDNTAGGDTTYRTGDEERRADGQGRSCVCSVMFSSWWPHRL